MSAQKVCCTCKEPELNTGSVMPPHRRCDQCLRHVCQCAHCAKAIPKSMHARGERLFVCLECGERIEEQAAGGVKTETQPYDFSREDELEDEEQMWAEDTLKAIKGKMSASLKQ